MEEKKTKLAEFRAIIEDILQNKLNVVKLNVIEFLALFFASIASMVLVATCVVLAMLFGAVALALFLNALLSSTFLGFLIVSGGFVVTLLILIRLTSKKGYPFFTDTFVRLFVGLFYDENEKD
jgi:hypothetical protein